MNQKIVHYVITAMIAAVTAYGVVLFVTPAEKNGRELYYGNAAATLVSPHSIRKRMVKGVEDFVLVDVRSAEEYAQEHVVGAVSVPAYVDRENSAQTDRQRIVADFRRLVDENPDKDIIIYCYSSSCMTGRKIGDLLAQNGVFVKEMTIGWNEWRHFWQQWNYPHEWENIVPEDYVSSGTEPGVFEPSDGTPVEPCTVDNEFGC